MRAIIIPFALSFARLVLARVDWSQQLGKFPANAPSFWQCNMSPNLHPDGEYSYSEGCEPPYTSKENGIKCTASSSQCDQLGKDGFNYLQIMVEYIQNKIITGEWTLSQTFKTAGHITCVNNICASYNKILDRQNNYNGNAGETMTYLKAMINYGCKMCGQYPVDARDMKWGGLVVDWTDHPFLVLKGGKLVLGELDPPNNDNCHHVDINEDDCW